MAEYVVKGAEPNETVLHTQSANGYESWQWLPVREESAVQRINDLYLEALNALEILEAENAKLREACAELLKMAESSDPEWLHWPEMHDELRELGVKIVKL